MIRQLELCDDWLFRSDSSMQRQGLRIDEGFVTRWTNTKLSKPLPSRTENSRANLQNLMRCLEGLDRCKSIILIEEPGPEEEYSDLLASISVNLSANLQTLILSRLCFARSQDYIPQYTLSNFSFSGLTTFDVQLSLTDDYLHTSIKLMLDSVVFTCSAIVKFSLYLDHQEDDMRLIYLPLIEHAHWPSLKTLELGGSVQLFDSQGSSTNAYVSFLARHSQIDCLSFHELDENEVETLQTHIPSHILPHLRALHTTFPLHLNFFTRAQHITDLQMYSPDYFSLARSLRSCIIQIDEPEARWTLIEEIVEAIPQLERLCVRLYRCMSLMNCWECECRCIFKYNPYRIIGLRNLTHLGLLATFMPEEDNILLWNHMFGGLPRLSYVYRSDDLNKPMLYRVVRSSDDNNFHKLVPLEEHKDLDAWEYLDK